MAKLGGGSDYDYIFKLILVGDIGVGKSNLLLRFTRDEFRLGTQSTIGVEFAYRQLIIEGKKIKTQIWDTAGQDRFKTVIPQLYRGSEGIFVIFDLTKLDTFENVRNWIDHIHQHTSPDLPIILIGNKSDLNQRRKIEREQAIDLAQELNISYMETSALNASNVETAFTTLVRNIYQKKKLASVNQQIFFDDSPESKEKRTIPVVVNPIDDITTGQNSFRLKYENDDDDEENPTSKKKKSTDGGCCKTS